MFELICSVQLKLHFDILHMLIKINETFTDLQPYVKIFNRQWSKKDNTSNFPNMVGADVVIISVDSVGLIS